MVERVVHIIEKQTLAIWQTYFFMHIYILVHTHIIICTNTLKEKEKNVSPTGK